VYRSARMDATTAAALRDAFLAMVRIADGGSYARRTIRRDGLAPPVNEILESFVRARLLVAGAEREHETLEVAHEALFSAWPQLATWLTEDRERLAQLDALTRAAEHWDREGRPADLLIHRDGRLKDAEQLVQSERTSLPRGSPERSYIDACSRAQRAREAKEREEQERRLRDAERIVEEQRNRALAQKKVTRRTALGLVASLLLAAGAGWQYLLATQAVEDSQTAKEQAVPWMVEATWRSGQDLPPAGANVRGVRGLIKHVDSIINLQKLQFLAPADIFVSGPHRTEFDWQAADFGHYNTAFVNWVAENLIPGADDQALRSATQSIYDIQLSTLARAYCHAYQAMQNDRELVETIKVDYLRRLEAGDTDGFFLGGYFYGYSGAVELQHLGLFGPYAHVAAGFWLRREIDGTADEFIRIVRKLLDTYDPEYARECAQIRTPFSAELRDGMLGAWRIRDSDERTTTSSQFIEFRPDGTMTLRLGNRSSGHNWRMVDGEQIEIDGTVIGLDLSTHAIQLDAPPVEGIATHWEKLYREQVTAEYDETGGDVDQYNATEVDATNGTYTRTSLGFWNGPGVDGRQATYTEIGRGLFGIYLYDARAQTDVALHMYDNTVRASIAGGDALKLGDITARRRASEPPE
jgi:Novel STAND NTPase 1